MVISGADRWPTLDLSLVANRRNNANVRNAIADDPDVPADDLVNAATNPTNYNAQANASWEIDLWGRLTAQARAARLDYEAALSNYESQRRNLVADISRRSSNAITENMLLTLFQQRLANLENAYEIVEGSYRRGLGNALDVYLAKNTLEQQKEALAAQQQTVATTVTDLQLALGRYPSGAMDLPLRLPAVGGSIPAGLPADLIGRRADLQAAWLQMLAADARLAAAHKNRFPSLRLSASDGKISSQLADVLSDGIESWQFSAGLAQRLFAGGRLRAAEQQARARAQAQEQQYLGVVFSAFASVENALSQQQSVRARLTAIEQAELNAEAALELSFEQYQRGLIAYTTVLESERRAFDASSQLLRLRNQLALSRVNLYLALGGEFMLDEME